ncbi:PKD domain-containing protein [Colwellia sp. E150_009]
MNISSAHLLKGVSSISKALINTTLYFLLGSSIVFAAIPAKPSLIAQHAQAEISSNSDFELVWDDNIVGSGVTNYQLQLFSTTSYDFESIYQGLNTSLIENRVAAPYSYRVKACNNDGCSFSDVLDIEVVQVNPLSLLLKPLTPACFYASRYQRKLSWCNTPRAEYYELFNGVETQTFDDKTLKAETLEGSFDYQIRACNVVGCSDYSAIVAATKRDSFILHDALTNFTASTSSATLGDNITISWQNPVDIETLGNRYIMKLSNPSGFELLSYLEPVKVGVDNYSVTLELPAEGEWGIFLSSSKQNMGTIGGIGSPVASTVIQINPPAVANNVEPAAPIFMPLTLDSIPSNTFNVGLKTVAFADYYQIYVDGNYIDQSNVEANLNRSLNALDVGSHDIAYKACNSHGCSPLGIAKTINVFAVPVMPTNLSVAPSPTQGQTFSLMWQHLTADLVEGAEYRIQEINPDGIIVDYEPITYLSGVNNIATNVTPLFSGEYTYRVRTCNAWDFCGQAAEISVNVAQTAPSIPTLTPPISSFPDFPFQLTWDSSTNGNIATHYQIEQISSTNITTIYTDDPTSVILSRPKGSYKYRIRACNNSGCSAYSPFIKLNVVPFNIPAEKLVYGQSFRISWAPLPTEQYALLKNDGSWYRENLWRGVSNSTTYVASMVNGRPNHHKITSCSQPENWYSCTSLGADYDWNNVVYFEPSEVPFNEKYPESWNVAAVQPKKNNSGVFEYIESKKHGKFYNGNIRFFVGDEIYLKNMSRQYTASEINYFSLTQYYQAPDGTSNQSVVTLPWNFDVTTSPIKLKQGSYFFRLKACNNVGCANGSSFGVKVCSLPEPLSITSVNQSVAVTKYNEFTLDVTSPDTCTFSAEAVEGASYDPEINHLMKTFWNGGNNAVRRVESKGGNYSYKVRSCNALGCSDYSEPVDVSVLDVDIQKPNGAPTDLAIAGEQTNTNYALTWQRFIDLNSPFGIFYMVSEHIEDDEGQVTSRMYRTREPKFLPGNWHNNRGLITYTVQACNSAGCGNHSEAVSIRILSTASASAGNDINAMEWQTEVSIQGSGTDIDGTIVSYDWTQLTGPDVESWVNKTSATTTFTTPEVSADTTLTFQLTVTDNDGLTGTDVVSVHINDKSDIDVDFPAQDFRYAFDEPLYVKASNARDSSNQVTKVGVRLYNDDTKAWVGSWIWANYNNVTKVADYTFSEAQKNALVAGVPYRIYFQPHDNGLGGGAGWERYQSFAIDAKPVVYQTDANNLYIQLPGRLGDKYMKISKESGVWVITEIFPTQEEWSSYTESESNYSIEFGEFGGDALEDFKLANKNAPEEISFSQTAIGYDVSHRTVTFIHTDSLGSPVAETDINGDVQ